MRKIFFYGITTLIVVVAAMNVTLITKDLPNVSLTLEQLESKANVDSEGTMRTYACTGVPNEYMQICESGADNGCTSGQERSCSDANNSHIPGQNEMSKCLAIGYHLGVPCLRCGYGDVIRGQPHDYEQVERNCWKNAYGEWVHKYECKKCKSVCHQADAPWNTLDQCFPNGR